MAGGVVGFAGGGFVMGGAGGSGDGGRPPYDPNDYIVYSGPKRKAESDSDEEREQKALRNKNKRKFEYLYGHVKGQPGAIGGYLPGSRPSLRLDRIIRQMEYDDVPLDAPDPLANMDPLALDIMLQQRDQEIAIGNRLPFVASDAITVKGGDETDDDDDSGEVHGHLEDNGPRTQPPVLDTNMYEYTPTEKRPRNKARKPWMLTPMSDFEEPQPEDEEPQPGPSRSPVALGCARWQGRGRGGRSRDSRTLIGRPQLGDESDDDVDVEESR